MKKNMGSMDRRIRIALGIVFGALYFTGYVSGTVGLILLVLGVVFIATSAINFCPLYSIFGFSTSKKRSK